VDDTTDFDPMVVDIFGNHEVSRRDVYYQKMAFLSRSLGLKFREVQKLLHQLIVADCTNLKHFIKSSTAMITGHERDVENPPYCPVSNMAGLRGIAAEVMDLDGA
jgi:hypothetical protein